MRKVLLATSAAALVLTISGNVFAERNAVTVAPPDAMTPRGLVFAKPERLGSTTPERLVLSNNAEPDSTLKPDSAPTPDSALAPATPSEEAPAAKAPLEPAQSQPTQSAAPDQAAPTQAAPAVVENPVAKPLQDLVESKLHQYVPKEHDRAGILAFYKARNFAPIWVADGKQTQRAQQAVAFLQGVAADGLDPADYPAPGFGNSDPAKLAADELAMTNSIVTYARHASIGRVAFTRVSGAVYFDQKAPDAAAILDKLAESADVRATLDGFNPQAPQYKALKAELAAVRGGQEAAPKAVPTETVHADNKKHSKRHDAERTPEVKPKSAKIDIILANMERWRWMPHELGGTYVMVNIPDYTLKLVQDGKTVWSTKIVVGKPGTHATPLLTETMKYITVNPTWNVPPSIIRNEYLPALAQDPDALTRIGLKVSHNPDGSIRIFQPPGERNALGRIRFNFPNRFLVYQHDTPDKNLFAKSERAFSHGCMRVQNPDDYAQALLGVSQPDEHYTAAKIRSMYGSNERTISFKHPIPVYITYQTAFTDAAGKTQARADIYGLDRDLLNVLHGDRRVADAPIARNYSSSSKPVMSSVASNSRRDSGFASFGSGSDNRSQQNYRSAYQPFDRFRVQ